MNVKTMQNLKYYLGKKKSQTFYSFYLVANLCQYLPAYVYLLQCNMEKSFSESSHVSSTSC